MESTSQQYVPEMSEGQLEENKVIIWTIYPKHLMFSYFCYCEQQNCADNMQTLCLI